MRALAWGCGQWHWDVGGGIEMGALAPEWEFWHGDAGDGSAGAGDGSAGARAGREWRKRRMGGADAGQEHRRGIRAQAHDQRRGGVSI